MKAAFSLRARFVGLCAAAVWIALPAQAGVFDDDEARRAILDLRGRLTQLEEASRKRSADSDQFVEQTQRTLLDLNNQNEQLRAEIARLRGGNEQLARDVAELQRKQKDIAQGVDDRLRKVEPQKVSLDGREFTAEPEEIQAYEQALATLHAGDFTKAATALLAFGKRYPASGYSDAVRYWLGNAYYGKRDYKDAIATFRAFIAAASAHPRASEALLAIANCQIEMKDSRQARRTLEEVGKNYPDSEAAVAARERLQSLK